MVNNVFFDGDDNDFVDNLNRASTSATTAAFLAGTQRESSSAISRRRSGPAKSTVKVKFYYLPEASVLPKFSSRPIDPLIDQHMNLRYGKD